MHADNINESMKPLKEISRPVHAEKGGPAMNLNGQIVRVSNINLNLRGELL